MIDWQRLMSFGFGVLHLSSDQFWSLSWRELEAALSAFIDEGPRGLSSDELIDLMARFPD